MEENKGFDLAAGESAEEAQFKEVDDNVERETEETKEPVEVREAINDSSDEEVASALDLPAAPTPPIDERYIALEDIAFRANIRPAYHGIEQLAETMHLETQLQACMVRPASPDAPHGKPFELIFGHRRKAAAEYLGWETLRCEVRDIPDEHTITQMILENFQREDLSPVAEARAIYELKHSQEPPMSNAAVARALGCDPSHVSHRLKLLSLGMTPLVRPSEQPTVAPISPYPPRNDTEFTPEESAAIVHAASTPIDPDAPEEEISDEPEVIDTRIDILDLVDKGTINASTAEVIASLDDETDRQKLTDIVIRNDWGVKKAAKWAKDVKINKAELNEGSDQMGPVEMVSYGDVTELQRVRLKTDLTKTDINRFVLYGQLRNGMDQEMLDFLFERMGYPYENLWDYVSILDDEQVEAMVRRMAVRYVTAAHRWFDIEANLKDTYALPEQAAKQEQLEAVEQTKLSLPGILTQDIEDMENLQGEDE